MLCCIAVKGAWQACSTGPVRFGAPSSVFHNDIVADKYRWAPTYDHKGRSASQRCCSSHSTLAPGPANLGTPAAVCVRALSIPTCGGLHCGSTQEQAATMMLRRSFDQVQWRVVHYDLG
jgi:hypothetical protein